MPAINPYVTPGWLQQQESCNQAVLFIFLLSPHTSTGSTHRFVLKVGTRPTFSDQCARFSFSLLLSYFTSLNDSLCFRVFVKTYKNTHIKDV